MTNENTNNLQTSFDNVKAIQFDSLQKCEEYLCKWALESGFRLIKNSGKKSYAIYLKCYKSGKPRKFKEAEGKRSKKSKKSGKCMKMFYSIE